MKGKDRRGISVVVVTLGQHVAHPRELNVSSIPIASSTRPHSLPLSLLLPPQVHRILRGVLLNQINPTHYTARECVCGEELDEVIKILIVDSIFTAEVVFHTNGECLEEVDDRLFFYEDFGFDDVRGRLVVGYSICSTKKFRREEEIDGGERTRDMEPNGTSERSTRKDDLRPVSPTLVIALKARSRPIGNDETDGRTDATITSNFKKNGRCMKKIHLHRQEGGSDLERLF
jgi:hypothetical protein